MLLTAEYLTWATDYPVTAVLVGLAGLVLGAEMLVRGAVWVALSMKMSQMTVGLTLVSIGTSLPELLVTITASGEHADLAMGNVMGSNVANILLIVGVTASVRAIRLQSRWLELSFLILLTTLLCVPILQAHLSRWIALVLLVTLVGFVTLLVRHEHREVNQTLKDRVPLLPPPRPGAWLVNVLFILTGLLILAFSADWLVEGAATVAETLGMSQNVIGLTVIAIGTSMPELATSAVAAWRGQPEICIGNVIGSNIFNIGAVLGCAGLFRPFSFDPHLADLGVTIAATALLILALRRSGGVSRWLGALMALGYAAFLSLKVVLDETAAA